MIWEEHFSCIHRCFTDFIWAGESSPPLIILRCSPENCRHNIWRNICQAVHSAHPHVVLMSAMRTQQSRFCLSALTLELSHYIYICVCSILVPVDVLESVLSVYFLGIHFLRIWGASDAFSLHRIYVHAADSCSTVVNARVSSSK